MEIIKLIRANIKHKKGAFKSIAALMAIITLCRFHNPARHYRYYINVAQHFYLG